MTKVSEIEITHEMIEAACRAIAESGMLLWGEIANPETARDILTAALAAAPVSRNAAILRQVRGTPSGTAATE